MYKRQVLIIVIIKYVNLRLVVLVNSLLIRLLAKKINITIQLMFKPVLLVRVVQVLLYPKLIVSLH